MKKAPMEDIIVLHQPTLEKVGVLRRGTETITIWRRPFDWNRGRWDDELPQYFIEQGGELQPFQAFTGKYVFDYYCPTPELLEWWIEDKLREGYELELEIEKLKYPEDRKVKINGDTLEMWVEGFLLFAEDENGRYYKFRNVRELLDCIFDVPIGGFPEYWSLLVWEKDKIQDLVADAVVEMWEEGEFQHEEEEEEEE